MLLEDDINVINWDGCMLGRLLGSETGLRSDLTMPFRSRSRRGTETATGTKVIFPEANLSCILKHVEDIFSI